MRLPRRSGPKVAVVSGEVPASPVEREQLVRDLVLKQLEHLGLTSGNDAEKDSPRSPRPACSFSELHDRVGQLEARLSKMEGILQDLKMASFHGIRARSLESFKKSFSRVAKFSPRGSPAIVETVLDDGIVFTTVEPPELEMTPRGAQDSNALMSTLLGDKAGLTVGPEPALPLPRPKFRRDLPGPQWGTPADGGALDDGAVGRTDASPGAGASLPWSREPDVGSVEDHTAAWLWHVHPETTDADEGRLGLELFYEVDGDTLEVTSVKDGPVARWNLAVVEPGARVEPGDVIVGVGSCSGTGHELLAKIAKGRASGAVEPLKLRRNMARWYRLKHIRMGYVEQPGRLRPGTLV